MSDGRWWASFGRTRTDDDMVRTEMEWVKWMLACMRVNQGGMRRDRYDQDTTSELFRTLGSLAEPSTIESTSVVIPVQRHSVHSRFHASYSHLASHFGTAFPPERNE